MNQYQDENPDWAELFIFLTVCLFAILWILHTA